MAAHFFLWDNALDRAVGSFGSTTYLGQQEALTYYLRIDPRRVLLSRQAVGSTLLCHEHFDDAFVSRNEFFQDYSLPLGRRYLIATSLLQVGSTVSILAILRGERQDPFGCAEQVLLERLRPHLRRAARMHRQFETLSNNLAAAQEPLNCVPTSMITTDEAAVVVEANAAAAAMLGSGNALRIVSGRLVAPTRAQTERLHHLIVDVTGAGDTGHSGGNLIVGHPDGGRHGVMVAPMARRTCALGRPARPLALVTIGRLEPNTGAERHLSHLFGLTQAEARLAAEVASGKRLSVVAHERGVRMPTLRTQMRTIFAKTGTGRQAELVHLIAGIPPPPTSVKE
jgi:DNA-binding CsgD family transcriptional regulator